MYLLLGGGEESWKHWAPQEAWPAGDKPQGTWVSKGQETDLGSPSSQESQDCVRLGSDQLSPWASPPPHQPRSEEVIQPHPSSAPGAEMFVPTVLRADGEKIEP